MDLPPAVPFVKLHAEFFRNLLGGDTVCNGVVVIAGVITDREPAAVRFQGIRHAGFLARSELLPGVIAGDGEVVPGSTLKMLQQYDSGIFATRRLLRERLFQFVAMSGSRAKDRNHIHRSCAFGCIVQTHSFRELWPGRSVDKRVGMPSV